LAALSIFKTVAEQIYWNDESTSYVKSVTDWADTDKEYKFKEVASLKSMAEALAASSPWALYDASKYDSQFDLVTSTSDEERTKAIQKATYQRNWEVAQTNQDAAWKLSYANHTGLYNTQLANTAHTTAIAQAELIDSELEASTYQSELPYLTNPSDIA
jgi:hypothetical protein